MLSISQFDSVDLFSIQLQKKTNEWTWSNTFCFSFMLLNSELSNSSRVVELIICLDHL